TIEKCTHQCQAVVKVAGTSRNKGRAFYCCPYWRNRFVSCGYFKWVDEDPSTDSVVLELLQWNCRSDLDKLMEEFQILRQKFKRMEDRLNLVLVSMFVLVVIVVVFVGRF
ncbi:hypothetical protein LINGRAHAP2_LOCUS18010, partial [Linum grandiflorum]